MSDDYDSFRRRSELEYLSAYDDFEKSLSPSDRATLKSAAVPDLDDHARSPVGLSADVASTDRASEWPDFVDTLDDHADKLREKFRLSREQAEGVSEWLAGQVERAVAEQQAVILLRTVGVLVASSNAKLSAAGLAYASDLATISGFPSMRSWAAANGFSPAAVSRSARAWQRELGLPPSPHLRDEATCITLSESQKTKHWRYKDRA